MFQIGLVIICLSLPGIPTPQHQADQEIIHSNYGARKENCKVAILNAAKLAKNRDIKGLIENSKSAYDPLHRVVNGYALYRLNKQTYRSLFLGTFQEIPEFPLYLEFLEAFNQQDEAPVFPGDKETFSYWSISNCLLGMAKTGDRKALRIWVSYTGGDGELGEGKSEDISDLLFSSPNVVISNWGLLRNYTDLFFSWGAKPNHFRTMRERYNKVLPKSHPFRKEIIEVIDRLKAEAIREQGESDQDIVEIKGQS